MELKNIFPSLNAMWVRWSAYEIAEVLNGPPLKRRRHVCILCIKRY